jgi:hypothetical protein
MNRYEVRTAESGWMIFDNQEGKFIGAIFPREAEAQAGMRAIISAAKVIDGGYKDSNRSHRHRKAQVIMDVVGTPEKNREVLIKALFLDNMNMTCTSCNLTYKDGADLEQLQIEKYFDVDNPNRMSVYLTCHCGHSGTYTFKPNPFMMSNVSSDAYGISDPLV